MVRFDCRVTGRPYPDVTWYINTRPILDDSTHKLIVNEAGNHSLLITVAQRTDAGTYTCIAKNKGGETSFQVNLTVIGKCLNFLAIIEIKQHIKHPSLYGLLCKGS